MIKLVAFDWNGTLFDDARIAFAADNKVLKKFRQKTISLTKFRQSFDMPIIKYWQNVGLSNNFLKNNLENVEKSFMENYEKHESSAKLRPGSLLSLKWLRQEKIGSVIYSNHVTPHIKRQLKRLKISKYFSRVLARELGDIAHLHERGKEQKLRDYIKFKNYKPYEIVSIGDTEEEIQIGKARGYHTIGITGGYNTTARLKKHHPDFLIHNMLELKKIIRKLNKT